MAGLECPQCGSGNVININLRVEAEGEDPVSFFSCHACEHRWWNRAGEPIELNEVLTLAKRTPRRTAKKR